MRKVMRLSLDRLPVHLRRRADSLVQRLVGLEHIAAACNLSVDMLMRWYLDFNFPLRRKGKVWVTTSRQITRWLVSLPREHPRQECRG